MTTIDNSVFAVRHTMREFPTNLASSLASGTGYVVVFGGQGASWLPALTDTVRRFALEAQLAELVSGADQVVDPVRAQLLRTGLNFEPLAWVDALSLGESAEHDEVTPVPDVAAVRAPVNSIPGILLGQLLAIRALRMQGVDVFKQRPSAVIAHSQGTLAESYVQSSNKLSEAELVALARLIGAAAQVVGRRHGLLGQTMLSISGAPIDRVDAVITELNLDVVNRIRNGYRACVVSGPEAQLQHLEQALQAIADEEAQARTRKETGGSPFAPVMEFVDAALAFHHPALSEAADLVHGWAQECGIEPEVARGLTYASIVDAVDWVAEVNRGLSTGAKWLLDLGPSDLAARMTASLVRPRGAQILAPTTSRGHRELSVAGAQPELPKPWSSHAPKVVTLPDGEVVVETAFTKLTGKSPILLAGMTPTTVDAAIVAAAANAGYWAELAGGGQVTEQIFSDRIAELGELLEPGSTFQFNSLFLDPYLWKLQLGSKRLVQRARQAGAAIDAVIVTAGIPELDDAVELIEELHQVGISHVVFKPGTVRQIRQVLAIADRVGDKPLIVQIEGGRAGGHHSWEDLDDLLLQTYAELRKQTNVVVCVGGGIGTPAAASQYLTGNWAVQHGYPTMPVDGVLVGTAAMATLEATTSSSVKQLLVDTPGTDQWIGAGRAAGLMASGRSQLGADIHEIDNSASRTGRLLDEVAGDASAVAERQKEIIEALNKTAKPYFGDLTEMTYASWLRRFVELSGTPEWLDSTMQERFVALIDQAQARLAEVDRGEIPSLLQDIEQVDGQAAIAQLVERYPHAETVTLHPADRWFFLEECRRPGKPVNFVPVIDADVRRWWRSDSLWQAHDERYDADQVCIIPGTVSVAGITRVDEPVAELLARFEAEVADDVLASGQASARVSGRRRWSNTQAGAALSIALAAPDVMWAGRTVSNPIHRLDGQWQVTGECTARNDQADASLQVTANEVELRVQLGANSVSITMTIGDNVGRGGLPVVSPDAAATAMAQVVAIAAPQSVGEVKWSADTASDHAAVSLAGQLASKYVAPDALVGLAWPTVFEAIAQATTSDGIAVIEGMLDLVHLDHAINVLAAPSTDSAIDVSADIADVLDTSYGRVIDVRVKLEQRHLVVAELTERFAIRGRVGAEELADPITAGGSIGEELRDTPRKLRAKVSVTAPRDMSGFAAVTGDFNPIHTSANAAALAGLGEPIVHGMWTSAAAQHQIMVQTGRALTGWTARFFAPVQLGASIDIRAERVGLEQGAELLDVSVRADGELVMSATGKLQPPKTAYAFPGQGIQKAGMGMAGYQRSAAAREIWNRADRHTQQALGFSILTVVRDNPTTLVVGDTTHQHPDGVLFLTQFTQVAMAVLGAAQMAELREAGAFVEGAVLAGHSVGEYNALAAVSGVISLEAVVEVVFQRGSVMHTLVPRDDQGRSDYRLAAIRPSQIGLADDEVIAYVQSVSDRTGEFLQIVNFNLRGSQYAIAGTVQGLKELETDIARRREEFGGKAAFILVPGIDVPFHSSVLHGGVPDFRDRLEELLPQTIDPQILAGRYVPNLVPRPFSLDRDFIAEIAELVDSEPLRAVLADFDNRDAGELCRTVLIELLAWQFASPVRWIETQDLLFTPENAGGLGVERFIEIGVGSAPTVANLASSTLKITGRGYGKVEVLNFERDELAVFARDEDQPEAIDSPEPVTETTQETNAAASAGQPAQQTTAASDAPRPDDLPFAAANATEVLIAWSTKLRLDQLGGSDSIESLCDGASSRRNQLLVDLGAELSLGAIDGAADADLANLGQQVAGLARGYRAFGSVLSEVLTDHLKKVLGPTGIRASGIADRVTQVWQLGPGWVSQVTAQLALDTREGASVRGGDLGALGSLSTADEANAAIDASIKAVGARHGVAVELPATGGGSTAIDAEALAEFTSHLTGPDGVLASAAKVVLTKLGLSTPATAEVTDDEAAQISTHVANELGTEWLRSTRPQFDERQAVLFDDRWASAREDVARVALGYQVEGTFAGAGQIVADQAAWWAEQVTDPAVADRLVQIGHEALTSGEPAFASDIAVVTGAGTGSIAAEVVGGLLAGGATVVATTSSWSPKKLQFFKNLYRNQARAGAKLWVVPANLASFGDVDSLAQWLAAEQTQTAAGTTTVVKPRLTPTLLFPFAAGPVRGEAADAGARAEIEMRILLWSVERLIGVLAGESADNSPLHVVLPGSPNRGLFGGDGAYGEAKAALDALVSRWSAESWADNVTLAHAIIGWVRGTGLMGANDPLVDAVQSRGVQTWSTAEMADALLQQGVTQARLTAGDAPVTVDLTGGLGDVDLDLRALAKEAASQAAAEQPAEAKVSRQIAALPPAPAQLISSSATTAATPEWAEVSTPLDDMVVIVGAGELGPYGSARTRFEVEVTDQLSAAGVLELAWTTGLLTFDNINHEWFDTESGEVVAEEDIADRYEEVVRERVGIRRYADDGSMVNNSAPLLASVFLEEDLTFSVSSEAEALALQAADPARTVVNQDAAGEWSVTRLAGTEIRVPRRLKLTRTVGGQIPEGFDPTRWGVPAEMVGSVDRVALWNLICTVDAFCSAGFSPAELMRWVHPSQVANTQGTGMGGMSSMHSLYIDTLLGQPKANDILQEALPNVIAAHVVQSYVGSYGAMVHPVAACATTAVSVEEGVDKIRLGKAEFVVAGGFDDLSVEGIVGFADMSATADSTVMAAKGIEDRYFSRANDRRYGGFVESQGGGTVLLARGSLAAELGLPVLGVVAYASSFADGVHTSIPAPGLGALAAGLGGRNSALARSLAGLGVGADDIGVLSKHDTSTGVNERNESELHERLAEALGRSAGNPLFVVSQKTLTGHAKGGAAAFQLIGLCQVLNSGVIPPNRSLDCVLDDLANHQHLVWLRQPLAAGAIKAGLVTSLGFGHVAGLIALVHPQAFIAALPADQLDSYLQRAEQRLLSGRARLVEAMYGGEPLYQRPSDRRLGDSSVRQTEAAMLLDPQARLGVCGAYGLP